MGGGRRHGRRGWPYGAVATADRPEPRARSVARIRGHQRGAGRAYGYVNRALPDAELDGFVDALATRISGFDKWAISNTKRLVNAASLAPEIEISAGWDACMTSVKRPAAQARIKALFDQGFDEPGDLQNDSDSTLDSWAQWRALKSDRPASIPEESTRMDLLTVAKEIADRVEAESAKSKYPSR